MTDVCALAPEVAELFFSSAGHHVQLPLARIRDSRVCWINRCTMMRDPAYKQSDGNFEKYRQHLLGACGRGIVHPPDRHESTGIADRYGGKGLGQNGGSGRAAVIGGYYVKGVGRTPLIGRQTDKNHASGGAYLEECVRETILAEIVRAEFPYGAVSTLAIIDSGSRQTWAQCSPPKVERRCLLIRPCFLRPAHFERAQEFLSADNSDGYRDRLRVEHMVRTATNVYNKDAFLSIYAQFWLAWSEQLAYAFMHRLPHGGDSTSNIAMDGSLLDFGAMAAVPSWARVSLNRGVHPNSEGIVTLSEALRDHASSLKLSEIADHLTVNKVAESMADVSQRFQAVVMREMLRVAGLTRRQAQALLASQERAELTAMLLRVLAHFSREEYSVIDVTREPRIPWDMDALWSDRPPIHLRPLRQFLMSHLELIRDAKTLEDALHLVTGRCRLRTMGRPDLYRERFKKSLFRVLETELQGEALNQENLDALIWESVCQHRRDSYVEPGGAVPIGFARDAEVSYVLFRCLKTGREFAVRESGESGERNGSVWSPAGREDKRLYTVEMTSRELVFQSVEVPPLHGTVWLL